MNDRLAIEVPRDMVENLYIQFADMNRPERMHDLFAIRNAVGVVLQKFSEEPELIHDEDFYDDLVRTMAIKIALERRNCFYSC